VSKPIIEATPRVLARRGFLATAVTLSGAAVALLAGRPGLARAGERSEADASGDAGILRTALGAEHNAVAAYGVGIESGLLGAGAKKLAMTFRDHHRAHADALAGAMRALKLQPTQPLAKYEFPVASLKQESDVLAFAAGLERGAISAYVGAIPLFGDRELSRAAATILADESMHWAVLRQALGQEPVPEAFLS